MLRIGSRTLTRNQLILAASALLFLVLFGYWFLKVGFSNPADRLAKEIKAQARQVRVGRIPVTFTHHPINQWTRPASDFYLRIERGGKVSMSYGSLDKGHYESSMDDEIGVFGNFEFEDIGTAVEIELMPGGDTVDVASVKPIP